MRQINSRILAMLLAVVMLIGMCPLDSFAAETLVDYTFNFRKVYYGPWSNYGYSPDYVTSFDMTTEGSSDEINKTIKVYQNGSTLTQDNPITTDPWMFDSKSDGATVGWNSSSATYGIYLTGSVGEYAAYRIRVSESGTFDLISRFSFIPYGAAVKCYLAPIAAENPRTEAYYIGSIDSYASAYIADYEQKLATQELASGDYVLSFVLDTSNENVTTPYFYTNAFLLSGVKDEYAISGSDLSLSVGEENQQELSLMLNGSATDFSSATAISVISNNSGIADVSLSRSSDGSRVYLTVEGISTGNTSVTISATVNGTVLRKMLSVSVNEVVSPITLQHDGKTAYSISEDFSDSLTLTALANGSALSFQNVSLSASVSDDTVLRATLEKQDDGSAVLTFTGLAVGEASVTVLAYYENSSAKMTIPVSVTERVDSYHYNFYKLFYGPWSNNGYDPKTITSFSMTTAGSPDEITPETPSDPWMFDSADSTSNLTWTSSSAGRGPTWAASIGGWCAYRIRVPESGIYTPETIYSQYSTYGNVTYYLAPVSAVDPRDDLYKLASVTGYATASYLDVSKSFRKLYLEEGDYVLSLVMSSKNAAVSGTPAFFIKEFNLIKPELDEINLLFGLDDAIAVDATERVKIQFEKNGIPIDISTASSVRAVSSRQSIAKGAISYSDDGKTGYLDVTGVAVGSTSIRVTVMLDGKSYAYSTPVIVKAADSLHKIVCSVSDNSLAAGEQSQVTVKAYALDGSLIDNSLLTLSFATSDPTIAGVDENGVINAYNQGTTEITPTVCDGEVTLQAEPITVSVTGYSTLMSAEIANTEQVPVGDTLKLRVSGLLEHGAALPAEQASVNYTIVAASPSGAATLSNDTLTGVSAGTVTVKADVTFNGVTVTTAEKILKIRSGKTRSSYYTAEKRAIAKENASKYAWAKAIVDSATSAAEAYVGREEELWNMMTTQELPRNVRVGYRYDPNHHICRYCGVDIVSLQGSNYAFTYNAISNPWKVQCPSCKRNFPTNDFEKFYESGIDEHGNWSYALALENGSQYLTNDLYPEMGEGWGVDDGYGYRTGKSFDTGTGETWEETHTYIAYYNHWAVWRGYITNAIRNTATAYVYSGDERYGRVAAIMVDRVADLYPDMDTGIYDPKYWNNGWYGGKILGGIWETGTASTVAKAYDAVFDLYDDPQVISFLSKKAATYNMTNQKTTGNDIRQNIDDNFLREAIAALYDKRIFGNFGYHQSTAANIAVVLDTMPETEELLDWMLDGAGAVNSTILANVSRDGAGNESSPAYNYGWASSMYDVMDALAGYDKYSKADLYTNPKIIKMFKMNFPLTLMRRTTAQIGDTSGVDKHALNMAASDMIPAFMQTGDVELGQMIYFLNGNQAGGIHGSIFTDSSKLQSMLQEVIDEHGEYPFDKSMQLTDYGFAILRSGTLTDSADTQRDFWIKYGSSSGHGHPAKLNLGIDAFGLNLAPDMGYPTTTLGTNDILYWERSTILHNTVQVDNINQTRNMSSETPLHFDESERVKVMDVDASSVYGAASIYRRSVVMVDAGDDKSYGVDFFRVKGGSTHIYSFHALSDSVAETEGLNLVSQSGTYAGSGIAYGPGNVTSGHDGLTSVMSDTDPENRFAIDFRINDFRNHATVDGDLHLRMTMLNDFRADDVATALGRPPIINTNPDWLQFALVRRTGTNLDTLFTTVFEPYCGNRFIASEEAVTIERIGGEAEGTNDTAKAVKVTLEDGRVDYIVYATNNQVKYRVDGLFDFMGVIGVYSLEDGVPSYAYLNDGTLIGSHTLETAAYTGRVTNFTTGLSFENHIQVSFDQLVDFDDLIGRFIDVQNSGSYNASYEIKDVTKLTENTAKLHIGDVTLLRGNMSNYDISTNMAFSIPNSAVFGAEQPSVEEAVSFAAVADQTAAYGKQFSMQVRASSTLGSAISYQMTEGPDGAEFDPLTRTFTWTPTAFGEYSATFTAAVGDKTATLTVPIRVLAAAPNLILGAQIRLTGNQGIRFIADMDRANLDALKQAGATEVEYGILLIPSADVKHLSEIVLDASLNGHTVAKVPAVYLYDITDTYYRYTAVITNIAEKNFARAYTARTYLTYRDEDGMVQTVYGDTSVSRSIYQVAKAALSDADRYSDTDLQTLQSIVAAVEG